MTYFPPRRADPEPTIDLLSREPAPQQGARGQFNRAFDQLRTALLVFFVRPKSSVR